jgi:hypothetical protein
MNRNHPYKVGTTIISPSYEDYRPKTNAVILLDMGHIREEHAQEEYGKGRKPKT